MFPNPQAALPLPSHPSIEHYRKLAKDLLKACRSGDSRAIGRWADRWLLSLARAPRDASGLNDRRELEQVAAQVGEFASRKLGDTGAKAPVLADAQFVIARSHGFESWPRFVAHLDRLSHAGSDTAVFEAAADAIVTGNEAELRRLLAAYPKLVRTRSAREHRATLLHYVSANGVEGYRQRTPGNILTIARMLLDAGSEVDAEAEVYGGGSTTLGLVATSAHPRIAGVQLELIQLLLERGARLERRGIAGRNHGIVLACLANGCPEAAEYLAERGAPLGIVEAAGVGRLDTVRTFFGGDGTAKAGLSKDMIHTAFRYACYYGRNDVVEYLIERGVDLAGHSGDGQTGMHYAAMGGKLDTIRVLLRHGAPLEVVNEYGGTVLGQTLWSAAHGGDATVFVPIVEALIAAGARLQPHPPVHPEVDALLERHGGRIDRTLLWFGEQPQTGN